MISKDNQINHCSTHVAKDRSWSLRVFYSHIDFRVYKVICLNQIPIVLRKFVPETEVVVKLLSNQAIGYYPGSQIFMTMVNGNCFDNNGKHGQL